MKNIKVNLTNQDGKRSSTTLNFAICEKYYQVFGDYGSEHGLLHKSVDEYRKDISDLAQSCTNRLVAKAVENGYRGIDQYYIESNMIEALSIL